MFNRRTCSVVVLSAGLALGWSGLAFAQDDLTAEELFQQGMKQYNEGDLQAARGTLKRVDLMQLSKEQRVAMYQTLQDIDRKVQDQVAPVQLMTQADEAQQAGNLPRALSLYQQVAGHPQASEAQKQAAAARVAEVTRAMRSDETRARGLIDQAAADINNGDLDAAESKLRSVQGSGVDLGWFENERIDRFLSTIAERRQLTAAVEPPPAPLPDAVAQAPAPEPTPVQPEPPAAAPEPQPQTPAPEPQPDPAPAPQQAQVPPEQPAAPVEDDLMARTRALVAQQKMAEAADAEARGQLRVARELYTNVLALQPDNTQAKAALDKVGTQIDQQLAPRDVLEVDISRTRVAIQAVVAEYDELMNRAERLRDVRNYAAAQEAVQQARLVLDRNQNILPTDQYRANRERAVDLSAQIAQTQRQEELAAQADIEQQRAVESAQRQAEAEQAQAVEVRRLLERARNLQREQRYDEALTLLNQALFIEPTNPAAQMMQDIIQDSRLYVQFRDMTRKRSLMMSEQSLANVEATMPYAELSSYPTDWPQLTARRLLSRDEGSAETEINRRVSLKLREPVPINFEANRLVNVIDYLRNTTGVNFFVNWPALEAAGVEQDTPISLVLTNIPAEQALRLVLQQAGAQAQLEPIGFSIIEGIVTVSTQRDLTRTTDTRVYDIRDLLVQVPSFSNAPEFDLNSALANTSSGGSGGGGGQSGEGLFGEEDDSATREVGPTRSELVEQITALIQDTVGRTEEWASYGGDVSSLRELNGNLIVRSTPENHRSIIQLLAQLREMRAMQISVEARFLVVDSNFLEEIGVDLDVQMTGLSNFGPINVGQDSVGLVPRPFTGQPGSWGAFIPNPLAEFTPGSGFNSTNRSLDIGVSYLDDLQINLIIRATQANRSAITLTAPRVTFFNGQRGYVVIVRQVTFVSDLEPIPNSPGFDPTLSVTQSGATLDVEGTISSDRRYVTLTLRPSLATLVRPIRTIEQSAVFQPDNDQNDGEPIFFSAFIEAPELELVAIRSTVSVPDKGTLLMGGQRLVADVEVEAGVPVLSKIPILNRLFTNTTKIKDERTLLVLIKPTIIIQSEEEENLFPGLLADPSRFNVGNRP